MTGLNEKVRQAMLDLREKGETETYDPAVHDRLKSRLNNSEIPFKSEFSRGRFHIILVEGEQNG